MTRLKLSVMFAWLAATACTTAQSTAAETGKEFRLTARKYQFSPTTINVKQGDRIKLIITAIEGGRFSGAISQNRTSGREAFKDRNVPRAW
jgi:hypothetical protein